MPIARIPLAQQIETRDGTLSKDSRCVNGYFETSGQRREFIKRPGIKNTGAVLPDAQGQGLYNFNGMLFAVVNNIVYSIDPTTYAVTTIGTMTGTIGGTVQQCYFNQTLNNTYLFIHNQVNGYTWHPTTSTFAQIVDDGITVVTVITGGSGYTSPSVTFSAPSGGGTTATGTVQFTGGVVTGITITNPGTGYTTSDVLVVTITDGGPGVNATASALLNGFPTGQLATGAIYLDTYTVIGGINGEIYTSNPNDPTTWNALNFITAEAEPDSLVGIVKHLNYVIAFSQWSTDFYYDAGTSPGSPLAVATPYHIELGCVNGDSIVGFENVVVWIGTAKEQGPSVYSIMGVSPSKISTPYIDRILNNSTLTDVIAYPLRINGHTFYILTLADLNQTLVYDVNEKVWYQWTMYAIGDSDSGVPGIYAEQYFRPSYFAGVGETYFLLDDDNGSLYTMSDTYYNDDGAPIYYRSITPILDSGTTKRKFYHRIELVGDKIPATLMVRHTGDDYKTWSNYRQVNLNNVRPQIYQVGADRRRAWEFLVTDNQPIRLEAAECDFDVGELENTGQPAQG